MNTMARAMASDRGNKQRALLMAQKTVLAEYAKPAPNITRLLSQTQNLRGSESQTPLRDGAIDTSMLSNIAMTLKGSSSYNKGEL